MPGGNISTGWVPLRRLEENEIDPRVRALAEAAGVRAEQEWWVNPRYQVRVRYVPFDGEPEGTRDGLVHLSINAHDRSPMRNWRHLQQMKNEVMGEDRTAVEIFPPEDHLTDTSNQYHLWVLPADVDLPFGFEERFVSTEQDVEEFNSGRGNPTGKGRQEPWEPGLTTGRRPDDRSMFGHEGLSQPERRPER